MIELLAAPLLLLVGMCGVLCALGTRYARGRSFPTGWYTRERYRPDPGAAVVGVSSIELRAGWYEERADPLAAERRRGGGRKGDSDESDDSERAGLV